MGSLLLDGWETPFVAPWPVPTNVHDGNLCWEYGYPKRSFYRSLHSPLGSKKRLLLCHGSSTICWSISPHVPLDLIKDLDKISGDVDYTAMMG